MPKKPATRDRGPKWSSPKQEDRKRPVISFTVSPAGKAALLDLAKNTGFSKSVVAEACLLEQSDAARSPTALARLKERCETLETPTGKRKPATKN
jgi:hypothetical protein